MIIKAAQHALAIVCVALAAPSSGVADTVVLRGKPAFNEIQITGFKQGKLIFRGVCQELLRKPLGGVARFAIDRNPMLSKAETLRSESPERAIRAYRRALDGADEDWLYDLIRVRLLGACDQAGRFQEAIALYADLLADDPDWVRHFAPRHPAVQGSAENRQARARLHEAIQAARLPGVKRALRTLLLELLLFDEVEPLPAELRPPGSQPTPERPVAASQPERLPPRLFGPRRQPGPRAAARASDARRQPGGPLQLPADSFVRAAADALLESGEPARAAQLVERALPYLSVTDRDPWLVLLGRCRIELGAFARAADELLALSESTGDQRVVVEALYHVALAHERMGRPDVAVRLYEQLLQRTDLPAETRARVTLGLKRLGE